MMKKAFKVIFICIVTVMCVIAGLNTRKSNAISVTQIKTMTPEGLSYLVETKDNNLVMIDGGGYDDSQHLEEILSKKGGVVDTWFVTIAHWQNFGALQRIIENGKIQINHIYLSFNPVEWYQKYEPDRVEQVEEFLDLIYNEAYMSKVHDVPNRFEIKIDNLYFTVLNVKNPELNGNYAGFNQSMVIKVNNTYKSMIFMGNIAEQGAEQVKNNNLDEIDCDSIQISNNNQQKVDTEFFDKISVKNIFLSNPIENREMLEYIQNVKKIVGADEVILSSEGDNTIKIW